MAGHTEVHCERDICTHLAAHGWWYAEPGSDGDSCSYDTQRALYPPDLRARLLADGVMRMEGDTVVSTRDHLFKSPSAAAAALLGRKASGWVEWKDSAGRTLDAVKRRAIEGWRA